MTGRRSDRSLRSSICGFFSRESGSVTVEFVIALPLLLGILAFAVQYGYAMQVRNALDSAARDAARYLSRAPYDLSNGQIDDLFVQQARRLVEERVSGAGTVNFEAEDVLKYCVSSEPARMITVTVTATVDMAIFSAIAFVTGNPNASRLTMQSQENWISSDKANNSC